MADGEEETVLLSAQNPGVWHHKGSKPWDHAASAPWLSSGRAAAAARTHPWLCGPLTHTKGTGVGEEGEEVCYRVTAVGTGAQRYRGEHMLPSLPCGNTEGD